MPACASQLARADAFMRLGGLAEGGRDACLGRLEGWAAGCAQLGTHWLWRVVRMLVPVSRTPRALSRRAAEPRESRDPPGGAAPDAGVSSTSLKVLRKRLRDGEAKERSRSGESSLTGVSRMFAWLAAAMHGLLCTKSAACGAVHKAAFMLLPFVAPCGARRHLSLHHPMANDIEYSCHHNVIDLAVRTRLSDRIA